MRRRCRDLLRTLSMRRPIEPHQLVRRLAEHRGRPVTLQAREMPVTGGVGLTVSLADRDVVVYPDDIGPAYQAQIIYHEVMHIHLGHLDVAADVDDPPLCVGTLGTDDGEAYSSLYDSREEWEAETAATILSEWSSFGARSVVADAARVGAEEAAIARALGGRWTGP